MGEWENEMKIKRNGKMKIEKCEKKNKKKWKIVKCRNMKIK